MVGWIVPVSIVFTVATVSMPPLAPSPCPMSDLVALIGTE
jgi:hypothetical protein